MSKSSRVPKDDTSFQDKVVRCERCGHRIGYVSKNGWQILCARCQRDDEDDWFGDDIV